MFNLCDLFRRNQQIDPVSQAPLKSTDVQYNILAKQCGLPFLIYNPAYVPDAPPEFTLPYFPNSPEEWCEGYWTDDYLPQPSYRLWPNKNTWVAKAMAVEKYIKFLHHNNIKSPFRYVVNETKAESLLIPGKFLKFAGYLDITSNVCWPSQYVKHYIRDNNVPPTERFYNYINYQYDRLPPDFKTVTKIKGLVPKPPAAPTIILPPAPLLPPSPSFKLSPLPPPQSPSFKLPPLPPPPSLPPPSPSFKLPPTQSFFFK